MRERRGADPAGLAATMTREASRQSYLTIRWLADRAYRADAFALYAWFRWLDDTVDERLSGRDARLAFVARQRDLLTRAADGALDVGPSSDPSAHGITPEEALLVGLAGRAAAGGAGVDADADGVLLSLRSMLDVMEFDARRRGRAVTQRELDDYTHDLAVAVTEALHHCIGHGCGCPHDETRAVAVTGAHIAHMLRDLAQDVAAGYLNLPADLLGDRPGGRPGDLLGDACVPSRTLEHLHTPEVRAWVRDRVELARSCFTTGRRYLEQVENARCRLAGHAYIARFEWVLDAIERDGYRLRAGYPERATFRGGLSIAADGARSALAALPTRRRRTRPERTAGDRLDVTTAPRTTAGQEATR